MVSGQILAKLTRREFSIFVTFSLYLPVSFGTSTSSYVLIDVDCHGGEDVLLQCSTSRLTNVACTDQTDVSVTCCKLNSSVYFMIYF